MTLRNKLAYLSLKARLYNGENSSKLADFIEQKNIYKLKKPSLEQFL
jgi:hypothetical protein